ncbi:hypothetical protein MesoLj131b_72990 (plasmid) [Mesorhizobium sp. 131-2-5]|nr:hypothetical protein MesoLj131b_72990 [Mesorhizobium sp. 131-2-5]
MICVGRRYKAALSIFAHAQSIATGYREALAELLPCARKAQACLVTKGPRLT